MSSSQKSQDPWNFVDIDDIPSLLFVQSNYMIELPQGKSHCIYMSRLFLRNV